MHLGTATRFAALALLLGAVSCDGSSGRPVTFELTIRPVPPPSQADLFEDIDRLVVRLTDTTGEVVEHEIDVERGTSPAIEDLGALPEGVTIELLGYAGTAEAAPVVARGSSGPMDVGRAETAEVEIFMAAVGQVATFYDLPAGAWGAAAASDGDGRFLVFGGAPDEWDDVGADTIYAWDLVPPAADFEPQLLEGFPAANDAWAGYTNDMTGRAHHSATLLAEGSHNDLGKILVAGGWESLQASRTVSYHAFLYDPSAEPGQAVQELEGLKTARAQHQAVALPSGNVVFFGGYGHLDQSQYIDCTETVEVYDAATREFSYGTGTLDHCMVDGAAAAVGELAMHCGGLEWTTNDTHEAYDDCVLVDRYGNISMLDGPDELNGAGWVLPAMASLGSDEVLISGGVLVQGEVSDDDWFDATARVWSYSTTAGWTVLPDLNVPRVGHVAAALPDGRVMVAGGAARIRNRGFDVEDELPCVEVYDGTGWTLLQATCAAGSDVGSLPTGVYRPAVAVDPYQGVLIWGGMDEAMNGAPEAQPHYGLYVPESVD